MKNSDPQLANLDENKSYVSILLDL